MTIREGKSLHKKFSDMMHFLFSIAILWMRMFYVIFCAPGVSFALPLCNLRQNFKLNENDQSEQNDTSLKCIQSFLIHWNDAIFSWWEYPSVQFSRCEHSRNLYEHRFFFLCIIPLLGLCTVEIIITIDIIIT